MLKSIEEGAAAYRAGLPLSRNPYAETTGAWFDWIEGWYIAHALYCKPYL